MSVIRLATCSWGKRRPSASKFVPVVAPATIIIGQLLHIQGENGIVAADTFRGLELFEVSMKGGAWFTCRDDMLCLDVTSNFPRASATPLDLICFEKPIDPIDRILHWGFGENLATLLVDGLVSSDWRVIDELIDWVPEFRPLLIDECSKYTPEGPSEAWNEILSARMDRAYHKPVVH